MLKRKRSEHQKHIAILSAADRDKLAQAVETIPHHKGTPVALFNAVGTFIEEEASDTISELWKAPLIAHLIDRVNEKGIPDRG
jgi:hypothetical protein